MKITIKHYEETHTTTLADDSSAHEVIMRLVLMLELMGFHPDNIKAALYSSVDYIDNNKPTKY